jgi:hypothetical protein
LIVAFCFIGILPVASQLTAEDKTPPSGRYGIDLEVTEEDGIYLIEAMITDLESEALLSAPQIRTDGQQASVKTTQVIDEIAYEIKLSVTPTRGSLSYRFEALHGDEVASVQEGSITYPAQSVLAIDLANNSLAEKQTKAQLERLLREYDLSRWIHTRAIRIDEKTRIPHSHPVLTLDTDNLERDSDFLAMFVHEQLHWFDAARPKKTQSAIEELKVIYPDTPSGHPEGARDLYSTYLHLILCYQEYDGLKELVGVEEAKRVLESKGYYKWIYRTVLDDLDSIRALVAKYGLAV